LGWNEKAKDVIDELVEENLKEKLSEKDKMKN